MFDYKGLGLAVVHKTVRDSVSMLYKNNRSVLGELDIKMLMILLTIAYIQ